MKTLFATVLLSTTLLLSGCPAGGAGAIFFPKPEVVKVTSPANAWATAKAAYHAVLVLTVNYAQATCPPDAVTGVFTCPSDSDPREIKVIKEAQKVHTEALAVIEAGDAVTDGDYLPAITKLNGFITKLTRGL